MSKFSWFFQNPGTSGQKVYCGVNKHVKINLKIIIFEFKTWNFVKMSKKAQRLAEKFNNFLTNQPFYKIWPTQIIRYVHQFKTAACILFTHFVRPSLISRRFFQKILSLCMVSISNQTPCWSPLVFWNIQCHWIFFPFQSFQFENMKIPFQF